MRCSECDNELSDDAKVCPQCGAQFAPLSVRVQMSVDEYVGELLWFSLASVVLSIGVGVLAGVAMIVLGVFGGLVGGV